MPALERLEAPVHLRHGGAAVANDPSSRTDKHRDAESLAFAILDLVPLAGADQIRDRWLRPFLAVTGQQEVPKEFHPYTLST